MFVTEKTVREILAEQKKQTEILTGIAQILTTDPQEPEQQARLESLVARLRASTEKLDADVASHQPTP